LKKKITYGLLTILLLSGLYFGLRFAFGLFTPFNSWAAGQDIKNGKIQIVELGEMPLNFEQKQKLANSYDFSFYLFGCNVSTDIIKGTEYYNKKMVDQLENKFGAGWWTKFQNQLDSIDNVLTNTQTQTEQVHNNNCVRGQAEPVIQKTDYPNTTFVLQPDSITAIETVTFDNGDKLVIRNWGCEYYVLTFRFETSNYQHDTTDLGFWFRAADRLMTSMLGGLDTPIDIKRGLVLLDSYILRDEKNGFKNLQLGEEIDFGGNDIRSFVTVDRIEKINDKNFGVTISFATGPL
jgi:hypothetical protein